MKHLNDQHFNGNRLREVGTPVAGADAANKAYVDNCIEARGVRIYRNATGTAAKTSSPYCCSRWDVTDESVTEYKDGMAVCLKIPVAGNDTYGIGFQINSLGYKPVVYNVNSLIGTRYGKGAVVWCVYNATQTANLYYNSSSASTVTGCWQVMDYYYNSNTIAMAYCSTAASTAAKVASSTGYVLRANKYLFLNFSNTNSKQGAITLNVNSTGAKPIYINGEPSSSTNYTLPSGVYWVYYDGTNYYLRTDGKLTINGNVFGGSYNDLADKPTIPTITFRQW